MCHDGANLIQSSLHPNAFRKYPISSSQFILLEGVNERLLISKRPRHIRRPLKGVKRRVRLSLPLCGLPRWGPLPGKPPPPPRHFCPGWFCSASSATCHPDMVRSFCKPVRSFCKPVRTSPEHLKSIIFIGGLFKIGLSCYTPRIYLFHVFQPFVLLFGWILMLIFSQKPSPDRFKPALTRPRSFKNRPRSILGFPRTVQEVPRPPKMLPRRLLATPK